MPAADAKLGAEALFSISNFSIKGQCCSWKCICQNRCYEISMLHWKYPLASIVKIHRQRCLPHDDVIKWKHFPRYWPFVPGIHWSPLNSPHKGQWRGALMFSLICVWINGVNKWWGWWLETLLRPLWRHCDEIWMWYVLRVVLYSPMPHWSYDPLVLRSIGPMTY